MAVEIRTSHDGTSNIAPNNIFYIIEADSEEEVIKEKEKIFKMFPSQGYGTSCGALNKNKITNKITIYITRYASCE